MDRTNEFFPLLNELLFKEECDVPKHIITKSDIFMFIRYASFYSPGLINILNEINKLVMAQAQFDGAYYFELIKSIIPKLRKTYINYISKKSSDTIKKANTFVKEYSRKYNISEQKVWQMLFLLDELEN